MQTVPLHKSVSSRRSKLRSSCDGCGAAKLKCDRDQPACGRCVSHGMTCIYGVSRKMGKPPRERLRRSMPSSPTSSDTPTPTDQLGTIGADRPVTSDSIAGNALDPEFSSNVTDVPISWDVVDSLYTDLPLTLSSLDFSKPSISGYIDRFSLPASPHLESIPTPESAGLGRHSLSPIIQPAAHQSQAWKIPQSNNTSQSVESVQDHACSREASEILEGLSLPKPGSVHSNFSRETILTTDQVPLDYVLRLNRDAGERLGRLLNCCGARSPHLTLLYASIISRILSWYQQAAGCTQSASSRGATANSVHGAGNMSTHMMSMRSTPLAVLPAKMVVGTFSVDDLRVQDALKIQLLSGETERAGRLIDQFSSHHFAGASLTEESTFGSTANLHQSLDSWLRSEHSRIANMMRSRLQELNT